MDITISLDDWVIARLKEYAEYSQVSLEEVIRTELEDLALSLGEVQGGKEGSS